MNDRAAKIFEILTHPTFLSIDRYPSENGENSDRWEISLRELPTKSGAFVTVIDVAYAMLYPETRKP